MAINIQNTNYNGEVLEKIMTLAATGNEIVERGLIHVIPNVSKKVSVPRLKTGRTLQKRKEMPKVTDSKGDFNYSEKTLQPVDFMAFTVFNPRSLEAIWRPYQPKGNLVFAELPAEIQNLFLEELIKQVKFELGWHYINGVEGTTDDELFNGLIVRMEADADTVKAGSSATTMIGRLATLRANIPVTMRANPRLRILMSINDFDKYDAELTEKTAKGVDWTEVSKTRFKGITIEPLANWPDGKPVATIASSGTDSNLFAAVNLQDDEDVVKIGLVENAGELYFFKLLMKADTNIAFGEEVIMLERVAPQISADKLSVTIPVGGGEETVTITATESIVLGDLPDGFNIMLNDNSLVISAGDNTGAAAAKLEEIEVFLAEHPSKKVTIELNQPNA